jgi:hypothetical protein
MKVSEEQTYRAGVMQMLTDIKAQTVKTNGRVSKLEFLVYGVLFFLAGVTLTKFPALSAFLAGLF